MSQALLDIAITHLSECKALVRAAEENALKCADLHEATQKECAIREGALETEVMRNRALIVNLENQVRWDLDLFATRQAMSIFV